MLNTSHYPSLELCKKLTELGFPETEKHKQYLWVGNFKCPSIAELLDEIPENILWIEWIMWHFKMTKIWSCYAAFISQTEDWPVLDEYIWFWDGNIPNALAEMYVWCVENNYITSKIEKWNENVETCSDCGIEWKKIDKRCPVCYSNNIPNK